MSGTVFDIVDLALNAVDKEVKKLHAKSLLDQPLDRSEASCLTDYIKALIVVRKDEREAAKSESINTKSDDELNRLAEEALVYLKSLEDRKEEKNEQQPTESSEVSTS